MTVAFDANTDVTVEVGFDAAGPLDSTFTWTDISAFVRAFDIKRGRSHVLDEDSAGTASIVLDNADRRFDPGNAAGAYSPNVVPGKPVRIQAVHNSITYDLWRGFTQAWPMSWPGQVDDVVVLSGVDAFQVFNLILLGNTEVEEASGTRIGNILDEIGWPSGASWRDLDAGAFNLIAITWDCQSGLQALRTSVDSEEGRLFMTGAGVVQFNDSAYRAAAAVSTVFDDSGDGKALDLVGDPNNRAEAPDINLLEADEAHVHQSVGKWDDNGSGGFDSASFVQSTTLTPFFGSFHAEAEVLGTPAEALAFHSSGTVGKVAVSALTQYSSTIRLAAELVDRNVEAVISWYDGAQVFLQSDFGSSTPLTTTGWTEATVTATSPASAALALVGFRVRPDAGNLTDNETIYWDAACIRAGATTTFLPSTRIVGDLDVEIVAEIRDDAASGTEIVIAKANTFADPDGWMIYRNVNNMAFRGEWTLDKAIPVHDISPWTDERHTFRHKLTYLGGDDWQWELDVDGDTEDTETTSLLNVGSAFATSAKPVEVGDLASQGWDMEGQVHSALIRDGIDGPTVADFNARDFAIGDSDSDTATGSAGNVWTINGVNSTIVSVPADVSYLDIQVAYDDAQVWNKVNVGRRNSTLTASSDDATSQTAYGVRVLKINDSLLTDATDAQTVADSYRDRFKDPAQYIPSLSVRPTRNQSVDWPAVLGLELDEKVRVVRNAPGGGSAIALNQFVEGITHTARVGGEWTTTFSLGPE